MAGPLTALLEMHPLPDEIGDRAPQAPVGATSEGSPPSGRVPGVVDLLLLAVLVLGVTWLNLTWVGLDQAPPPSDASTHSYHSLLHFEAVRSAEGPAEALARFLLFREHYPPLVYQVTTAVYAVLGTGPAAAVGSLAPFLLVLAWSLYGLGSRLGGRLVGLACGIAACTAPPVLQFSRVYFLDLPLAAMVALASLCLARGDGFRRRGWALGFGAALGLGLLAKWSHPVYLAASLGASLAAALRSSGSEERRWLLPALLGLGALAAGAWGLFGGRDHYSWVPLAWWPGAVLAAAWVLRGLARWMRVPGDAPLAHAVGAALVALALAAPWYAYNAHLVLHKVVYQAGVHVPFLDVLHLNARDLGTWLYLGPVLLAAGLAVGLARPELRGLTLRLAGDLVVGLLAVSLLPQDTRYLLPLAACLLPLSFAWMAPLRSFAAVPAVLLLALGLFQAGWHLGEGAPALPSLREARSAPGLLPLSLLPVLPPVPDRGSYPYRALMASMRWVEAPEATRVDALVRPEDAGAVQPRTLLYEAALENRSLVLFEVFGRREEVEDVRETSDFLLFYRDEAGREELMDDLERSGALGLLEASRGRTFRFGPEVTVEVLPTRAPEAAPEASGGGPG